MTVPLRMMAELLADLREKTLTALLEAQAAAIASGAEIEIEPIRRNADGAVLREGPLDLPSRSDLLVVTGTQQRHRQFSGLSDASFEPFVAFDEGGFAARIAPFLWDQAAVRIEGGPGEPNWTPLRLWFLEYFQSRQSDLSPELSGSLHRLDGPWLTATGWRAVVDFGSAPLPAVPAMIAALGESGCRSVTIYNGD